MPLLVLIMVGSGHQMRGHRHGGSDDAGAVTQHGRNHRSLDTQEGNPQLVVTGDSATDNEQARREQSFILGQDRRDPLCPFLEAEFFTILDCGGRLMLRSESTRLNSSHVSISYALFCLK